LNIKKEAREKMEYWLINYEEDVLRNKSKVHAPFDYVTPISANQLQQGLPSEQLKDKDRKSSFFNDYGDQEPLSPITDRDEAENGGDNTTSTHHTDDLLNLSNAGTIVLERSPREVEDIAGLNETNVPPVLPKSDSNHSNLSEQAQAYPIPDDDNNDCIVNKVTRPYTLPTEFKSPLPPNEMSFFPRNEDLKACLQLNAFHEIHYFINFLKYIGMCNPDVCEKTGYLAFTPY